jgi:glycyl-tRNA synthetase beta chain
VLVCAFDKEFLGVPQECLIPDDEDQPEKYFPLLSAFASEANALVLVVSNINRSNLVIGGGNERVVRPRLAKPPNSSTGTAEDPGLTG